VRDPLIIPAIAVATGIFLGRALGFALPESLWPMAAFLLLAIFKTELRTVCITLALVMLGIFAEAWHRPGPPPEIDAGSREILVIEGCVVEPTVFSANREQFTLELDRDARARVSLNLRDDDTPQRLDYGQHVEIEGRIRRPRNYNNPGSFDYAGYLARQKIFWTATMTAGSKARVLPGRCGSRFMAAVFALRVAALERIESLFPDDAYSTGMMEAILIGETSKLEKIWTESFRRTGTFHALVISGVHVTVLAGVLLFLLRLCALPEIPALAITAFAAWVYALVSGFSAPVVRAAGGFTLYLAARFFFRRGRVLNLIAAVALIYLLWDPGQLFDASFVLSFLCVAAIGALGAPLLEATSGPYSRGLRSLNDISQDAHMEPRVAQFRVELRLAAETITLWTRIPLRWASEGVAVICRLAFFTFEMAAISTIIQIGLSLPMAEYFHRVSFTGLTANLLIVPLLNAVVPLGFIAIFTGWRWVASIAGILLKISAGIADWHAAREPNWRVPDPPLWLALAFVGALAAVAMLIYRPGRSKVWRWPAIAAVLATFALLIWHPGSPAIKPGVLELTAIDVGQGDSLLMVFPQGKIMLIDGGGLLQYGRQRRSNLDTGEDVVSPYLWTRGIRRVDVIVATHAHEDHSGGVCALIANFHPAELWVGTNPLTRVLECANRFQTRIVSPRAPQQFAFSGTNLQILSPPEDYFSTKSGNNDSLAFRVGYGARNFVLTGDMERPMESGIVAEGLAIHADVLKVGHHGSKTSTTPTFLDAVSPLIAIISVGAENSFGHPHRDVISRLSEHHIETLRTDENGLVSVQTDGHRLWIDTMAWRGEPALWIGERSFNWAAAADW
jgi:competence protein ComEC